VFSEAELKKKRASKAVQTSPKIRYNSSVTFNWPLNAAMNVQWNT